MGRCAALELARNGAKVFILGRTEEKLVDTLKLAEQEKMTLHYKVCDVSNMENVTLFLNELVAKEVCPDIVVNCAGVINVKKDDGSFDDDIIFRVNIMGMMNVCDAVIQKMISCKNGEQLSTLLQLLDMMVVVTFHHMLHQKGQFCLIRNRLL